MTRLKYLHESGRAVQPTTSKRRRTGITFLEVSIASVLVGLLFVGAIRALGSATRTGFRSQQRVLAAQLARGLQSEICGLAYRDLDETPAFGPEASEATATIRSEFNDVDDFDGWAEAPIVDRDGNALPNVSNWRRTVTVEFVDPSDLTQAVGSDQSLKRVTVQVSQISPPMVLSESVGYRSAAWTTLSRATDASSTRFAGNRPPIAKIAADVLYGSSMVTVNFQGTSSIDLDGDLLTYAWDFGDGGTSSQSAPTHNFVNVLGVDQTFAVELTVTDEHGAVSTATKSVVVVAE